MEEQGRLFAILIVVFVIFHSGETLKCYKCNSLNSKTCADGPLENETEESPSGEWSCVTYKFQRLDMDPIIQREYISSDICNKPSVKMVLKGGCTECNTDLCNNAGVN